MSGNVFDIGFVEIQTVIAVSVVIGSVTSLQSENLLRKRTNEDAKRRQDSQIKMWREAYGSQCKI